MSAYFLAKAITPDAPDVPDSNKVVGPPPAAPAPPPPPPPPTQADVEQGAVEERKTLKNRRGVASTIYTSPLGIATVPDTTRLGG